MKDKNNYEIYKDFNTKDWIIYNNETNRNIVHCDTKEKAENFLEKLLTTEN